MTFKQKISLLSLLGILLPAGNLWGPYLARVPRKSDAATFRTRLLFVEIVLSIIFAGAALVSMSTALAKDAVHVDEVAFSLRFVLMQMGSILIVGLLGFAIGRKQSANNLPT